MKTWHSMEVDQVVKELDTDPYQGLSHEEAQSRLERYGYNELKKGGQQRPSFWTISNILTLLLLVAAVLSLILSMIVYVSIRASEAFDFQKMAFNLDSLKTGIIGLNA